MKIQITSWDADGAEHRHESEDRAFLSAGAVQVRIETWNDLRERYVADYFRSPDGEWVEA